MSAQRQETFLARATFSSSKPHRGSTLQPIRFIGWRRKKHGHNVVHVHSAIINGPSEYNIPIGCTFLMQSGQIYKTDDQSEQHA